MYKQIVRTGFIVAVMLGVSVSVSAGEKEDITKITSVLKSIMPNATPDSVNASVVPGMYEAVFGPQVIYVSNDGRYIFEGDLYDITTRTNLTEIKRRDGREKVISNLDADGMIIFSPENPKYTITAFTDIDCGYCRKLHNQIDEYNKLGIAFRYLSYPRSGVNTPSYAKALSVWCAKDPKEAITFAKGGAKLEQVRQIVQVEGKDCKNTVLSHMNAAKEVGVTGTPTLVIDNGQVIPGYVEPERLLKILDDIHEG